MNAHNIISKYIQNKEYYKVLEYIENENIPDFLHEFYKWTPLVLLLISNNNLKVITDLIHKFPKYLDENVNGAIPFHLIYEYGHIDLIKHYITENPNSMNAVNRYNANFIGILVINNDYDLLSYAIVLAKSKGVKLFLNNVIKYSSDNTNILEIALRHYIQNTTRDLKMVTLIIDSGFNQHNNYDNQILMFIAKYINDVDAYKLLRKYATNNINRNDQILSYSLLNSKDDTRLVNYIIEEEPNFIFTANDIYTAIIYGYSDIVKKLLTKVDPYDITFYRSINQSSLLTLSLSVSNMDYEVYYYLIEICDINQQNIAGNSPLHFICAHYNINYFTEVLSNKLLNIFAKNKKGETPLGMINRDYKPILIDLFINSYRKYYNITTSDHYCLKDINKNIFDEEKCIKYYNPIPDINMTVANNAIGFWPVQPFTVAQYYLIAKKNKSMIYMPSIGHIDDIFSNYEITDSSYFCDTECKYGSIDEEVNFETSYCPGSCIQFRNIVNIFKNYNPSLIIWESETNNVICKDFIFYFIKAMMQPQRYIVYSVGIYFPSTNLNNSSWHANTILYDKVKNTLERFDSNAVTVNNLTVLDDKIYSLVKKGLHYYYGHDIEVKFEKTLSNFQYSGELYDKNEKYGDVPGYCQAWCLWFIDTRINYPNLNLNEFIHYYIEKIRADRKLEKGTNNIMVFIRSYANYINNLYADLCILSNIPRKSIYEAPMPFDQAKKMAAIVNNLY